MRNIERVILWGLPPSFCALVQRAGRAAGDFGVLGDAVLIVPPSLIKKGLIVAEIEAAVEQQVVDNESANLRRGTT
jgi:hypothetical protein